MTDEIIIQEAVRLVDDGVSVTFPVKGTSMLPFIIGGKESVILQKASKIKSKTLRRKLVYKKAVGLRVKCP